MELRARQTATTAGLGAAVLTILLIAGAIWKIQGISLFLSLMTAHDAIHKALQYVVENAKEAQQYSLFVTSIALLFLIIAEILKPRFSKALEKHMPAWAAKLVFIVMVSVVMLVPVTGLADLLAQLGGLILAVLAPALQKLGEYVGKAGEGAAAAVAIAVTVFVYIYILRHVSNMITKPKYDMWTSGLIAMGLGYIGGLLFGVFTVMGYELISELLGAGTGASAVIFEILAIALVAEALSEAWKEAPKLGVRVMLWLPAVNILLLAVKSVLGDYSWIVDVLTLLFTFSGVGGVLWGILFQNTSVYIAGCTYCASLLAIYSVYEQAVQQSAQQAAMAVTAFIF